ncbi:type II secretion system protein [bacterium]|nr:type II secretion system protein [bacterium]
MKKAFTLAETLITLSILGIVAAITIPALINKYTESANRTKVKKAMTTYEKVINSMLIENDLRTEESFKAWAKTDATTNNYKEQVGYFKVAEMSTLAGSTTCRFKTSDRVWWDICGTNDSNIENPIVILDEKYKDESREDLETMAKIDVVDGKKVYVFGMAGRRDVTTGSIRINDKSYEDSNVKGDNPFYMAKLYGFMNNQPFEVDPTVKYSKPCPNQCDVMGYMGGGSSGCSGCSFDFDLNGMDVTAMFDEDGNLYKGKITRDNGRVKGIFNSDMSYSEMSIYSTGEKEFDYTCSLYDVSNMTCAGTLNEIDYYKNGNQKAIIDCKSNCGEGHSYSVSEGEYTSVSMDGNQTGTITAFYKTGKSSYKQTRNEDGTYCNIAYETDGVTIKAGYPEGDGCED